MPETSRAWPSCSSSVTIQLPATTASPKVAICTAQRGHSRRSRKTLLRTASCASGWRATAARPAASTGRIPASASTSPVQYGARQPSEPTSCGTTISASPPAAIVEPP